MHAYRIVLRLFEGRSPTRSGSINIITIASCIELASQFARQAVTEADETTPGFNWRVIHAEEIPGEVAIPALKRISPTIDDE